MYGWVEIKDVIELVLVAASGSGALALGFNKLKQHLEKKQKKKVETNITLMSDIHDIMNDLSFKLEASRCLLMVAQNGGNYPKVGKPLYTSILYETYDWPVPPIKLDWQRRLVDDMYIRLLSDIIQNNHVMLKTSTMKQGVLKTVYETTKIKSASVHIIETTGDSMYYLTTAFLEDKKLLPADLLEIDSAINKIKVLLHN